MPWPLAHSHMVTHASLSPHHCPSALRALLSSFFLVLTQQISTYFAIHENSRNTRVITATPAFPSLSAAKCVFTCCFPPPLKCLSVSSPPPAATPRLSGIFRGEQRQSAETKVALHPEEASGAHQQVPEAIHLKTKYDILTAQTGPEQILSLKM